MFSILECGLASVGPCYSTVDKSALYPSYIEPSVLSFSPVSPGISPVYFLGDANCVSIQPNRAALFEISTETMTTADQRYNTKHVHEEPIQSSPRLRSKLLLDHRSTGEDGMRVHSHLNGYAHHQDSVSRDSVSENEDQHRDEAANNYTSSSNDDDNRCGGDDDNDDDYYVIRNVEESSEKKDDDGVNDDDNDVNCDENCEIEYPNDHESSNCSDGGENFSSNNGVSAKSCTIHSLLCPKEDKTFVESHESDESLTEELHVSLRFNSQYSIDEDTGNSSAENNDESLASSSSNNDSSFENSNTRSDKKKAKDLKKTNSFKEGNNTELSAERDVEATSQGARPKILPQNLMPFNPYETNYHDGKIPSLETAGITQNFLARHSTDPSLPQSSFAESYEMRTSNKNSNSWTQHSISSNSSSSSLRSLPGSPALERSGLMLENAYSRALGSRERDLVLVNYQPVTPMPGQFPDVSGFSRGVDSFNWNENLPRNKHQTGFSSFEDFSVGNETQTASPLLGVRPLAPAVGYPAVTAPNFPTTTWQFSSSTTSRSVAPVTSTYVFSCHRQEHVGDFNRYRPSHVDTQSNSGLTSSEMVHSERRHESLRSHGPFNYQQEDSFALVSDPSLVSLEQQVAEIDRVLKEREERTKKQREATQRHRDTRERRQREARERKEREEREMREQEERERREREQREMREREEREMREREERGKRERMERELKERRERETTEREERMAEESLSLQETPQWQCEHYQRRCSVKFPCCGVFYPCHRCHNLSATCPADDRKAHHATHVKCGNCGHEEEVCIFCILEILRYRRSLVSKETVALRRWESIASNLCYN